MTKIVKRKHWDIRSEPNKPRPPIEPRKTFDKSVDVGNDLEVLVLKDLKLPEGFTLNDVHVSTDYESYYLNAYVIGKVINKNYDEEYVKYNKKLVKFNEDLKRWDKEIIEYRAWKKEFEKELLEKQIEEARKLLKKHDKRSI